MQRTNAPSGRPILEVIGVGKTFAARGLTGGTRRVVAAEDVSFSLNRGEAVALVGESGSGKSTLARLLLRLDHPDAGEIRLDGENVVVKEPHRASLAYRGRVQMVFQDPFGSLNPVHTVLHHLERPLLRHGRVEKPQVHTKALELLRTVGLEPAEDFIHRRPFELSGGQRQRVAIARALAVEPDVLVADEPTSMLDVSIRMGVLNLLSELKRDKQLAILLITHDLASARYLADRILVLFRGRIVEDGPSAELVENPSHPYTRALLSSIASAEGSQISTAVSESTAIETPATGCPFASRCPDAFEPCSTVDPSPRSAEGKRVRCHLYPEDASHPVQVTS